MLQEKERVRRRLEAVALKHRMAQETGPLHHGPLPRDRGSEQPNLEGMSPLRRRAFERRQEQVRACNVEDMTTERFVTLLPGAGTGSAASYEIANATGAQC